MTMRELDIRFQHAMNELQASFEKQHREWQQSYQALQQLLEEAKQREAALRAQNEQLRRKLSTAVRCRNSMRWCNKSKCWALIWMRWRKMPPPSTTTCIIRKRAPAAVLAMSTRPVPMARHCAPTQ